MGPDSLSTLQLTEPYGKVSLNSTNKRNFRCLFRKEVRLVIGVSHCPLKLNLYIHKLSWPYSSVVKKGKNKM